MKGENSTVLKTFGGDEDYIWSLDSKSIFIASKKGRNEIMQFPPTPIFRNRKNTIELKKI
jgi:hypothetical protein